MMWYGGFGEMGLLGPLMMLLFWGGVILLMAWAFRAFSGGRSILREGAEDILKRRLASGELTQDQFEQSLKAIQG
ncbi:MAG: SHOCT domain-containing protein [Candidatus Dormibacteraceae bacterium]